MISARGLALMVLAVSVNAEAKIFQNSYLSFEVPEDWTCIQEGVAWTCTPQNPIAAKEAVIVLAAKVAGPEDSLNNFLNFLNQPKKIVTRVGTPMPSAVMYAHDRVLGGNHWIQAQHLGSEIQDYYTLYLATVKDQLAILVSFSAEKDHFAKFNPIFDKAIRTLTITANNQLLFPKSSAAPSETLGIQGPPAMQGEDMMPPPEVKPGNSKLLIPGIILLLICGGGAYYFTARRKKISHGKNRKHRSK